MKLFNENKIDYSNIIDLGADKEFYYGEISQNDFLMILSEIKEEETSATDAVKKYCARTCNQYFLDHAIGHKRGMCIELFDDLKGKNVLDYGCGLGSIGIGAIKKGANVTFAESCFPRLQMANYLVNDIANSNDHKFVAVKNIDAIFGLNQKYDLIIVNGLLEWLPSTIGTSFETALQAQLDFLTKCRDLLTVDGRIFIGMENRFAFVYQIGYPEDHTEIVNLSVIDRDKANELHKRLKQKDFVNFTWSYDDYYKNAEKIEMEVEKITGMFPDYRFVEKIIDLNNCDKNTLIDCIMMEKSIHKEIENYTQYLEFLNTKDMLKYHIYSYGTILRKK